MSRLPTPVRQTAQILRKARHMIYAAASFWLLVFVLMAWGVDHLWRSQAKPKTLNAVLFPGTLVAQVGRIIGLLITGATVAPGAPKGEDGDRPDWQPKLPVIGPVLVALIPMAAISSMLYLVMVYLGPAIISQLPADQIPPSMPLSLTAFWEQLRRLITLSENTLNAVRGADIAAWQVALFVYLMICLTIRMAPSPGNVRGHVGAVVILGVIAALAGSVWETMPQLILSAWPLLALSIGWVLLVLLATLLACGIIQTTRLVLRTE
ncbi:MAG TPA: hypothetical protein VJZ71_15100 [Phycisphaerae bacterium]|nr:hypothetical protein [Phycisphaerae bacterium]